MVDSRFRNALFYIIFCVVFSPSAALAEISPKQLLVNLFEPSRSVGYYASYVNIRPSGMQYSDVYSGLINEEVYKRTILSGDANVEIVSTPAMVTYFDANAKEEISYPKRFIQSELRLLSSNLEKAHHYYSINVVENAERVAERETYRLSVMAKLPGRYSRVYWIDKSNFITLRVDVLDVDGQLIERIKCTSLLLKEPEEHTLAKSKDNEIFRQLRVINHSNHESIKFGWLPDEFEMVSSIKLLNNDAIETQYMLSDGFSKVTVVVNPRRAQNNDIEANHERDAKQKFVTNIASQQVVVKGDMPLGVVKKIATNLSR